MTFTLTPRLGLPQWSDGKDVPSRAEFDNAYAALEAGVPLVNVGVDGSRGATDATPSKQFYYATDTGVLWFMDGSQWQAVGRVVANPMVVKELNAGANLLELRDGSNNVLLSIDASANLRRPGAGDFVPLTLPSGVTLPGGSAAHPGYYITSDGLLVMQGQIVIASVIASFTLPRPRDLQDHVWAWSTAKLFGSGGTFQIGSGVGTATYSLDGISYMAEVL